LIGPVYGVIDRGATILSYDPLHEIGDPMTRSKAKEEEASIARSVKDQRERPM